MLAHYRLLLCLLWQMKCVKYWPEDQQMFGTTDVTMHDEKIYADCTVRWFSLRNVSHAQKFLASFRVSQSSNTSYKKTCNWQV